MKAIDWILLLLIGMMIVLAVRKILHDKKYGRGCCGGGSGCTCGTCSSEIGSSGCAGCGNCSSASRERENL